MSVSSQDLGSNQTPNTLGNAVQSPSPYDPYNPNPQNQQFHQTMRRQSNEDLGDLPQLWHRFDYHDCLANPNHFKYCPQIICHFDPYHESCGNSQLRRMIQPNLRRQEDSEPPAWDENEYNACLKEHHLTYRCYQIICHFNPSYPGCNAGTAPNENSQLRRMTQPNLRRQEDSDPPAWDPKVYRDCMTKHFFDGVLTPECHRFICHWENSFPGCHLNGGLQARRMMQVEDIPTVQLSPHQDLIKILICLLYPQFSGCPGTHTPSTPQPK